MKKNKIKKIIVMPGIHVYKNVLKDCKKIIKCFEDNEDSLLSDWEQWETQGYKKGFSINEKNLFLKKNDSKKIKKQKKYINKINKCLEIVFNDYVSFYLNENVPWPENVNINKLQILNDYYMGFYKYDVKHMLKDDFKKIAMRYHVDDITGKGGLTFTYYLNDNYDGGEICFYNKNDSKIYQYKPSPGDITVFPSGKPFYHGVNKISKNNRYHLRNFIYCVDNDKNILDKYKDSKNTIDIYYPEEDVNLEKIDKEYSVFLKEKPIIVK